MQRCPRSFRLCRGGAPRRPRTCTLSESAKRVNVTLTGSLAYLGIFNFIRFAHVTRQRLTGQFIYPLGCVNIAFSSTRTRKTKRRFTLLSSRDATRSAGVVMSPAVRDASRVCGGIEERLHHTAQAVVAPEQSSVPTLAPARAPRVFHLPIRNARRRHRCAPERDARRRCLVGGGHARQLALVYRGACRLQMTHPSFEHSGAARWLTPLACIANDRRAISTALVHCGGVRLPPRFPIPSPCGLAVGGIRRVGGLHRAGGGRRLDR
jgi:hypothetical protein